MHLFFYLQRDLIRKNNLSPVSRLPSPVSRLPSPVSRQAKSNRNIQRGVHFHIVLAQAVVADHALYIADIGIGAGAVGP